MHSSKEKPQSIEKWNDLLNTLETVAEKADKKKLHGRDRLIAASYVRRMFEEARSRGHQRQEIQRRIGRTLGRGGFRIDKWMIAGNIDTVDETVEELFQSRSEPQKKLSTYLAIVDVLSELLGEDAERQKIRMLEPTRHWKSAHRHAKQEEPSATQVEPHQRLADLLHTCARSVAKRCDLERIWRVSERHNLRWATDLGPIATVGVEPEPEDPRFRRELVPSEHFWEFLGELPPYPAADIGRIPFSSLKVEIRLGQPTEQSKTKTAVSANHSRMSSLPETEGGDWIEFWLRGYWKLSLSICPINGFGDVGAKLLQYPCYYLAENQFPGRTWLTSITDPDYGSLFSTPFENVLIDGLWRRARAKKDEGWQERINVISESLVSDKWHAPAVAFAEYNPIDASLISEIEAIPYDPKFSADILACTDAYVGGAFYQEERLPTIWYTPQHGLLRNIEIALLNGQIESRLIQWTEEFLRSLDQFEQRWRIHGYEAEQTLRQRWRDSETEFERRSATKQE